MVFICFLITTLAYGTGFTFGVYLRPLHNTLGWTIAKISGAYSLCLFLYTGFSVIAGWGVDRYGPKVTTLIGGSFLTLGFILSSFTSAPWHLYGGYALVGLGMSFVYTPLMTTITKKFTNNKGLALGLIGIGISAGPLILAPLTSYIIHHYHWRIGYLIFALLTFNIILFSFLIKTCLQSELKKDDSGTKENPDNGKSKKTPIHKEHNFSFKQAILVKEFWFLCTITFMIGLTVQMVIGHIVAYCEIKGMNPLNAAAVLSTIAGGNILGKLLMGMVSDKIGRQKTLTICLLLEGIAIYLIIQAPNGWSIFLIAAVFGFGYGGHGPQLPAITGEYFGFRSLGTILGATTFFYGLAGAIGIAAAGVIVDVLGSYDKAYLFATLAMLIGLTISCLLRPPQTKTAQQ